MEAAAATAEFSTIREDRHKARKAPTAMGVVGRAGRGTEQEVGDGTSVHKGSESYVGTRQHGRPPKLEK